MLTADHTAHSAGPHPSPARSQLIQDLHSWRASAHLHAQGRPASYPRSPAAGDIGDHSVHTAAAAAKSSMDPIPPRQRHHGCILPPSGLKMEDLRSVAAAAVAEMPLGVLNHNSYHDDLYAKEFGINIIEWLASVEARVLPAPQVGGRNIMLADAVSRCIPMLTDGPTIIFGADVTDPHPGEDNNPSIAAGPIKARFPCLSRHLGKQRAPSTVCNCWSWAKGAALLVQGRTVVLCISVLCT